MENNKDWGIFTEKVYSYRDVENIIKENVIIQIYKFINQDKFNDVEYMDCPEKLNVPVFLERIKQFFDVDYEGVVN